VRLFIEGNAIFVEEFHQWAEEEAEGNRHVFSEI
jgi:hypothetical protein